MLFPSNGKCCVLEHIPLPCCPSLPESVTQELCPPCKVLRISTKLTLYFYFTLGEWRNRKPF